MSNDYKNLDIIAQIIDMYRLERGPVNVEYLYQFKDNEPEWRKVQDIRHFMNLISDNKDNIEFRILPSAVVKHYLVCGYDKCTMYLHQNLVLGEEDRDFYAAGLAFPTIVEVDINVPYYAKGYNFEKEKL